MVLGYIGFGEAAFEMSTGLKGEGLKDIVAFDSMVDHPIFGAQIKNRAASSEVELLASAAEVIAASDLVMVAVPASVTLSTCETVIEYFRPKQLYVDLTAASPSVKKAAAALASKQGADFADVAIMAVVRKFKHKVPILASGSGAYRLFETMSPYGMQIEIVGEEPGAASGIKLVRSLCMKGMAAVVMETLEAAVTLGIADRVVPGICKTLEECTFEQTLDRLSVGTALHAARRAAELAGCMEMLRDTGIDSTIVEAAFKKHELIAKLNLNEHFAGKPPQVWSEVIETIVKKIAGNC
jgi:3-hydroxyisobutyrate dehydrogenase-like beta-hydroxyacid dehydrogenase